MSHVVVTGLGAVCALAHDCRGLIDAIGAGVSGIEPIRRFDTAPFRVRTGAEVKDWPDAEGLSEAQLCLAFATRAAEEALRHARVSESDTISRRLGLVFGTNLGDLDCSVNELASELGDRVGADGPRLAVATACSSSTTAIGLAKELLHADAADVVLAGGADVLTPRVFAGFHALGVLAQGRCAPFSTPFGTSLGEGAGFLVLERAEVARDHGMRAVTRVAGFGLAGDGYHATSPDPLGGGVERAARAALADAELQPEAIGYVNAHGSGTEANDAAEWNGLRRLFRARPHVPVSSTKGAVGHAQGAAGALEVVVTILMMERGLVPPTLNFAGSRPIAPPDPVGEPAPRATRYGAALCLNSGFGGANAALVLSRTDLERVRERPPATVRVRGIGLVGPGGLGEGAFGSAGSGEGRKRVPPFDLARVNRRVDPRGLDPASTYLVAAGSLGLTEACGAPRPPDATRAGLVTGTVRPSPRSLAAFARGIEERGLGGVSATAFARIVQNAPAGTCSELLGLRGPNTTVDAGLGSGLAAIIVAAMLARRDGVDTIMAAAVDEIGSEGDVDATPCGEGAICVVLAPAEGAGHDAPAVLGWGIAGPGARQEAVDRACAGRRGAAPCVFDAGDYAVGARGAWALPSALAFVDAVRAIRSGRLSSALVTSDVGPSASMAVLLAA